MPRDSASADPRENAGGRPRRRVRPHGSELTEKQQRFVEAYCGPAMGNATEAARMAGYKGNAKTLGAVGAENLAKPGIAEAIRSMATKVREAAILDATEIQTILSDIARGRGEEPHVLQSGKVVRVEPNLSTRRAAAVDLAKMLGLFVERFEVKTEVAFEQMLGRLRKHMSEGAYKELLAAIVAVDEEDG